jgi:hypothetical protein
MRKHLSACELGIFASFLAFFIDLPKCLQNQKFIAEGVGPAEKDLNDALADWSGNGREISLSFLADRIDSLARSLARYMVAAQLKDPRLTKCSPPWNCSLR